MKSAKIYTPFHQTAEYQPTRLVTPRQSADVNLRILSKKFLSL